MEVTHCPVQVVRGGPAPRQRESSSSTPSPSRKLNWKQQRHSHQFAAQHAPVTPENRERLVLPRSSSFEAHPDLGPQTSHQPQMMKVQARAYNQRPSASFPIGGGPPPPGIHAATVEGVPASGHGSGSGVGREGPNQPKSNSFSGISKKQAYRQLQESDRTGGIKGGRGEEERVGYASGALGGRTRPRPSSARHPASRTPLVYRKPVTTGSRDAGGDPVQQSSFFPLLSTEDEVHWDDRLTTHNRTSSTGTRLSVSGSGGRESETAPAAAGVRPTAGMAVVAAAPAGTATTPRAKGLSSPRPFLSKPQHHRERVVSQPLRAHPTPFSPKKSGSNGTGSRDGSAAAVGVGSDGNGASGPTGGSHHHLVTTLATEASAKLVVSRAPRTSTPPTDFSAAPSSTFASILSGAGAGVSSAEGPSQGHGGRGHHSDPYVSNRRDHHPGENRQFLAHQLSRSETTSAASSPRTSGGSSSSGMGHGAGKSGESAGYRPGSGGVVAPPHGGQTIRGGGSHLRGEARFSIGDRNNSGSSSSSDSNAGKTRGVYRTDAVGGGRSSGRPKGQSMMIPEETGYTNTSGSSNSSNNAGTRPNSNTTNRSTSASYGSAAHAPDTATELVPKRGPSSASAVVPADAAGGKGDGVLIPGPDGAIEVRELEGGVLLVRRNAAEKRRSPERLNLHRRRLTSCPVIQGDTRLRLLNYQNNLISKISNLANLPSLIFIDLYNNVIDTMEGMLATMTTLRVMMIGKNKIDKISNLGSLRKLDVLDLHSNSIKRMEGLDSLQDLRVLNLAGNQIRVVENVSCLTALTELNLRRNVIEKVTGLDSLPRLQRLFLSNNRIGSFKDCLCVFSAGSLLELSLDGNPVADQNGLGSSYRRYVLHHLPSLHHLDLKRVTDDDHERPRGFSQLQYPQYPHSGSHSPKPTATTGESAAGVNGSNGGSGRGGGGNNGNISARSHARSLSESGRPGTTKQVERPSTTDGAYIGNKTNSSSKGNSNTSVSSRVQEQQHHRWASAKAESSFRSSGEGQDTLYRTGVDATTRSDGMSRAAEAREAVAAKRLKAEREDRERTALKERREAIEAARECWERRGRGTPSSRPRHRTPRHDNIKGTAGSNESTSGCARAHLHGPPSRSPRSPTPPDRRRASSAGHPENGSGASSSGSDFLAVAETNDGADTGGAAVTGRRSREPTSGGSGGEGGGGGGKGRRGGSGVSGGVGYFELEQRISRTDENDGGHGDDDGRSGAGHSADGGGVGGGAAAAGVAASSGEGERSSGPRQGSGPGITLKVYGDVWRWLGDEKVCSLRDNVVEARFSLVHVSSVARKAEAIAQTFPNLSCLQMLDNDIRSLKQLERLRPLLGGLHTLHLGRKNPLIKNASTVALRAWVKAQGCGPKGHLNLEIPPATARREEERGPINGRGGSNRHMQGQSLPSTERAKGVQSTSSPTTGRASNAAKAPPPPQPPPTTTAATTATAPGPHPSFGTVTNRDSCGNVEKTSSFEKTGGGAGDEDRDCEGGSGRTSKSGYGGSETEVAGTGLRADGGGNIVAGQQHQRGDSPRDAYQDRELASVLQDSCGAYDTAEHSPTAEAAPSPTPMVSTAAAAADAAFQRLSAARDRSMSSSWGAVVLSSASGSSSRGTQGAWDVAKDGAGGGNAWTSSSRGAKLACNLMVRRVCEAHKRKENFGFAWETTVAKIIEGVLTPDTAAATATTTTLAVYGGGGSAASSSPSPRKTIPPPRPKSGIKGCGGGPRPRGAEEQPTIQGDRNQTEGGQNTSTTDLRATHVNGGVGAWTPTPRARWLDEW